MRSTDVLRLSRGMTYKSAISGINLGGGKSVIISSDPAQRTEAFWLRLCCKSLMVNISPLKMWGTSTREIGYIMQKTKHVSGKPIDQGGGGDPCLSQPMVCM